MAKRLTDAVVYTYLLKNDKRIADLLSKEVETQPLTEESPTLFELLTYYNATFNKDGRHSVELLKRDNARNANRYGALRREGVTVAANKFGSGIAIGGIAKEDVPAGISSETVEQLDLLIHGKVDKVEMEFPEGCSHKSGRNVLLYSARIFGLRYGFNCSLAGSRGLVFTRTILTWDSPPSKENILLEDISDKLLKKSLRKLRSLIKGSVDRSEIVLPDDYVGSKKEELMSKIHFLEKKYGFECCEVKDKKGQPPKRRLVFTRKLTLWGFIPEKEKDTPLASPVPRIAYKDAPDWMPSDVVDNLQSLIERKVDYVEVKLPYGMSTKKMIVFNSNNEFFARRFGLDHFVGRKSSIYQLYLVFFRLSMVSQETKNENTTVSDDEPVMKKPKLQKKAEKTCKPNTLSLKTPTIEKGSENTRKAKKLRKHKKFSMKKQKIVKGSMTTAAASRGRKRKLRESVHESGTGDGRNSGKKFAKIARHSGGRKGSAPSGMT